MIWGKKIKLAKGIKNTKTNFILLDCIILNRLHYCKNCRSQTYMAKTKCKTLS